eukprot:8730684-Pyramimonas_sp.AAC.1
MCCKKVLPDLEDHEHPARVFAMPSCLLFVLDACDLLPDAPSHRVLAEVDLALDPRALGLVHAAPTVLVLCVVEVVHAA